MATTQITPSKQVRFCHLHHTMPQQDMISDYTVQAAASLENLKVKDSPVKKLNFNVEDKENMPVASEDTVKLELETEKKPVLEVQAPVEAPKSPKTLKELEQEEDILKENPQRFVLFPIKYHEIVSLTGAGASAQAAPARQPRSYQMSDLSVIVEHVQEGRG